MADIDKATLAQGRFLVATSSIALDLLFSFTIAKRLSLTWRIAITGLIIAVVLQGCRTMSTGSASQDYGHGFLLGTYVFLWIYTNLLDDHIQTISHKKDKILPKDLPLIRRMYWALCFKHASRNVGYSNQVTSIPPGPTASRRRYIFIGLLLSCKYYLYTDIGQTYIHTNPIFALRGTDAVSITVQGFWWQAASMYSFWISAYGLLSLHYTLLSVVAVALGISDPVDWPPLFGNFGDAYTIRRAWGRTWHQMLRHWVTPIGKLITSSLDYKPGTWQSSYIQLYTAFLLSGLAHSFGDVLCSARGGYGRSLPYFVVQALIITFEDGIIALARRLGLKETRPIRYIGYIWTATWFVLCGPLIFDIIAETGTPSAEALPYPLLRSTWKYFAPGVTLDIPWNLPQSAAI